MPAHRDIFQFVFVDLVDIVFFDCGVLQAGKIVGALPPQQM